MISTANVSLRYGAKKLFEDVNVKFSSGNCYGLIGANGAGKSTFLKILSKEIEPNTGEVIIGSNSRLSVLKQDHYAYDDVSVIKTVLMGNARLFKIIKEKEDLYSKENFSEADQRAPWPIQGTSLTATKATTHSSGRKSLPQACGQF